MRKVFGILVACIIIIAGGVYFLRITPLSHQSFLKDDAPSMPIHVLESQDFYYIQNFVGSVLAIQSVGVVPYLSGFLKEVHVHAGEEVKKGDVLFLLDERIPLSDLNQAKEAVSQALATRENAKIFYERMKNTDANAISPTDLEQAKTEFEAADALYQKTLAAQNQAQVLYNYTIIKAPISGWVGNITATEGEYLSPEGKTLATIVRFSPIRLTFSVPMSIYRDNFKMPEATLQVVLSDGHILSFTDYTIVQDNQANKTTDSLSFFVDVPNDEKNLIPGAYIEIRFVYPEKGILINKNWLTLTPEGAEVYLLKKGIIEKQQVTIKAPINNQYWITSGLEEGDQIITVPVSSFQVGQPAEGVFE